MMGGVSETVGPVGPTPTRPRRGLLAGLVSLLVLAAVVIVVVLLADDSDSPGTGENETTATPSTPTDDPPTEDPEGPGTLISRSAFTTAVPETMRAWRIVYETTDARGRRDTATAT